MAGYQLDLAGAVGLDTTPLDVPLGGAFGASWWFGKYDETYALGRWNSLGVVGRLETVGDDLRITPMLEFRKGYDLLVLKPWFSIAAGTELGAARLAPELRIGTGVKLRRSRFMGVSGRLDGGVALLDGEPVGRFGILLGFDWAAPFKSPQ